MSIIVMLVDRKNIAYSNKGKSSKVKKFVRKTLMNKKFQSRCCWIENIGMYQNYSFKFINQKNKFQVIKLFL